MCPLEPMPSFCATAIIAAHGDQSVTATISMTTGSPLGFV